MIPTKIKILALFIVSVMLLGVFCACAEDPYYKFSRDLEPLTEEQIEECNAAYREAYFGSYDEYVSAKSEDLREQAEKVYYGLNFIRNNVYTPYLGTFSGTIVVGSALGNEDDFYKIGDSVFVMGSLKTITVCKDGKFVTLSQAYNSGWLTDDDIAVISERIAQYDAKLAK